MVNLATIPDEVSKSDRNSWNSMDLIVRGRDDWKLVGNDSESSKALATCFIYVLIIHVETVCPQLTV